MYTAESRRALEALFAANNQNANELYVELFEEPSRPRYLHDP